MDLSLTTGSRIPLGLIVIAYAAGTPGFGIDMRTGAPPILGAIYAIAFLTAVLALGASWKWPRAAAWVATVAGAFAVVLPALDLTGALAGPPPGAMVVLDVVILGLGLVCSMTSVGKLIERRRPSPRR